MTVLSLSLSQICLCFLIGIILSAMYLIILWGSLKRLPHITHKGFFLFISAIIRLALFLTLAIWFSNHNPMRFLCIFIAFVITRLIVVGLFKTRSTK